jgi:hypothetical protein
VRTGQQVAVNQDEERDLSYHPPDVFSLQDKYAPPEFPPIDYEPLLEGIKVSSRKHCLTPDACIHVII